MTAETSGLAIRPAVAEIIADIFQYEGPLAPETGPDQIERWDSLQHIALVRALEQEIAMSTRGWITALLFVPIDAVLFGTAACVVLAIPALSAAAAWLLPAFAALSLALGGWLAWFLAPRARLRFWRARGEPPRAVLR